MFTRAAGPAWLNGWVRSEPQEGQASRGGPVEPPAPEFSEVPSPSLAFPTAHLYRAPDAYTEWVGSSGVYQVDPDTIFRVTETVEGGLHVEVLQNGVWIRGRIGMVGLRLRPTTTKLSPAAIRALPA